MNKLQRSFFQIFLSFQTKYFKMSFIGWHLEYWSTSISISEPYGWNFSPLCRCFSELKYLLFVKPIAIAIACAFPLSQPKSRKSNWIMKEVLPVYFGKSIYSPYFHMRSIICRQTNYFVASLLGQAGKQAFQKAKKKKKIQIVVTWVIILSEWSF